MISKNKGKNNITNMRSKEIGYYLSSRQLFQSKADLLAKGLNFSITSKTLPNNGIIVTVEDVVKDLEKEEADTIRVKRSVTLQN